MEYRNELEQMRHRHKAQGKTLALARERRDVAQREIDALLSELQITGQKIRELEEKDVPPRAIPGPSGDDATQKAFDSYFGTGDDRDVSMGGFKGIV